MSSLRDGQRLGAREVDQVACRKGGLASATSTPELRRTLGDPQRKKDPVGLAGCGRWVVRGLQPEHQAADCIENLLWAKLQLEMR